MRTIVYVDGFNLYFRLVEKRPTLKWLNIKLLAETVPKSCQRSHGCEILHGVRFWVHGRDHTRKSGRHAGKQCSAL